MIRYSGVRSMGGAVPEGATCIKSYKEVIDENHSVRCFRHTSPGSDP
jgi:hypothetical protein